MLVLANALWGLSFPIMKAILMLNRSLVPAAGAWFISAEAMAPRFLVAALAACLLAGAAGLRVTRREAIQGAEVGGFATLGTLFQCDGLQYTSGSVSAFLTQFSAILIPLWMAFRHRRNPGALVWFGCILVLAGVAILGHFDWRSGRLGRGEWETLLCSVFFGWQIIGIGKREYAGNRPAAVTRVILVVQAVLLLGFSCLVAPRPRDLVAPWASAGWVSLTLVFGWACTFIAFSIMTRWQPSISSTEAGLLYCIEPIFASLFVLFLPGFLSRGLGLDYPDEHATWSLVVGGGLITVANIVVQMKAAHLLEASEAG
jgi:drug/metabolite transporter (DMT)-like permease